VGDKSISHAILLGTVVLFVFCFFEFIIVLIIIYFDGQ